VAVDEASHEVFVADYSNVERFSFSGGTCSLVETLSGLGAGGFRGVEDVAFDAKLKRLFVLNEGSVVNVFEVGVGEHYLFSIAGGAGVPRGGQGFIPLGVAVDEATGVLYVSDFGAERVDEFSASASGEEYLGGFSPQSYVVQERLAVNAAGDVFVRLTNESHVYVVVEFDKEGNYVRTFGGPGAAAVAVDPDPAEEDVFVAYPKYVEEFTSNGELVSRFGGPNLASAAGMTVDGSTHEMFVTSQAGPNMDVFGPSAPAPSVTTGGVSDVLPRSAVLSGVVNPESGSLPASYQFEYATEEEYSAPCKIYAIPAEAEWESSCGRFTHKFPASPVVVGTGTSAESVSLDVTGLLPSTRYRWRIVGLNENANGTNGEVEGATGSFYTAGAPKITEEHASSVGFTSMKFDADVDPGGLETTYYLEYGTSEAYGSHTVPVRFGASEHGAFPVSVEVTGLQPGVVYHARLVASNSASEPPEGLGPTYGGDLVFTTFPLVSGLPDGRVFELVTPVENHNAEVYSPNLAHGINEEAYGVGPFQAAAGGGGVSYEGDATPQGNGEQGTGEANQYLAQDTGAGWVQSALSLGGHDSVVYEGFSSDLAESVFRAGGGAEESTSEANGNEKTPVLGEVEVPLTDPVLYLRDDDTGALRALFTHFEKGAAPEGKLVVNFAGGSEDFNTLLFEASAKLTPNAPGGKGVKDLYEWDEGRLSAVNVLPHGVAEQPEASFGAPGVVESGDQANPEKLSDFSNDISRDGSRVFWTGLEAPSRLYMSETGHEPVQLDLPNRNLLGKGGKGGEGVFWTATPDGSRVFFTDDQKLTSESTAEPGQPDLYEYDVERPVGERLVDLTVAPEGEHAGVQAVIGASEDGSYVYFVANGVLSGTEKNGDGEVAQQGSCVPFEAVGACNLYVWHEGTIRFIAVLTGADGLHLEADTLGTGLTPGGDWTQSLSLRTSEVSPSGGDVLFMQGSEVYVYDAASGELSCVSCNTSGEPPRGGALLPQSFNQSRTMNWMSADGDRVFFDSAVPLVPQATNGFINVYEWERDGAGECQLATGCIYLLSGGKSDDNSYLIDASASGDEVFIATRAQLVPEDQNESFDLYDVRVGGATPASAPVCTGTGCQGVPQAPPIFATPASGTFSGLGNFMSEPPPPPKKVVKKTVKCRSGFVKKKIKKRETCVKKKSKKKAKRATNDRRGK
jgi:hypothetical protein